MDPFVCLCWLVKESLQPEKREGERERKRERETETGRVQCRRGEKEEEELSHSVTPSIVLEQQRTDCVCVRACVL